MNLDARAWLCYNPATSTEPGKLYFWLAAAHRFCALGGGQNRKTMTLEFWRNLSVVWITIHLFVLCLVPLGIAFLAVRGMNLLLGRASDGFKGLQDASGRARARTEESAAKVTNAVVQGQNKAEQVQANLRRLLRLSESAPGHPKGRNGSARGR